MKLSAEVIGLLCISLAFDFASGDIISSMVDVETLMETEKRLLSILRVAKQRETEQLNLAERYVRRLKKAYNAHLSGTWDDIAAWPVKALQFIRNATDQSLVPEFADSLRLLRSERHFPDEDDLKGIAMALHRLQNTYHIQPRDIAYGHIPRTRRTPAFSAREAFIVGQRHASEGYANSAAAWLQVALEIFNSESEPSALQTELLDWLQFSVYTDTHNAVKALSLMKEIQKLDPSYPNISDNVKMYEDVLKNSTQEAIERMRTEVTELRYDRDHYGALCRGEDLMDPEVTRQLRCYLETHGNPYLLLQPVKMELANLDPVVIVVHNAILDAHSERIKAIATQHLTRARVVVKTSAVGDVSSSRISKLAFLEETVDSVLKKVNIYTGYAANLNVTQAEPLVVNNYGVGGYYYSHYDFLRDKDGVGHHLIEPEAGR